MSQKRTNTLQSLGQRIREMRKNRALSLDALSDATGISRAGLSKIERGEMSPTYDSLCKLAQGFGMEFSALLDGPPAQSGGSYVVNRAGQGVPYETGLFRHRLLQSYEGQKLRVFETEVTATSLEEYSQADMHNSEDLLFVLSGNLRVHLEGHDPIDLLPGDSLHMSGQMPHALISIPASDGPNAGQPIEFARILWVTTNKNTAS